MLAADRWQHSSCREVRIVDAPTVPSRTFLCLSEIAIRKATSTPPTVPVRPFLRWAGGKRQIISKLQVFLPEDLSGRTYFEPFLGAGSMFFALEPASAVLSDANRHLIACYRQVRDQPKQVADRLRYHAAADSETHYYRVRNRYNASTWSPAQAARFIYLNRTCYGGIFRVNTAGAFNVPYGWKEFPLFPSQKTLVSLSHRLQPASILVRSFEAVLENAKRGDFVYLDPPYPPLNGTAYFTHYTMDRFGDVDQARLAEVVRKLNKRGCLIMMTNADTQRIRRLYKGLNLSRLSVTRFVSAKLQKHRVNELVITNY